LAGGDASAHESVVGMMERQVNHLVRLVDDLLDISRITRGKIELRKERVELAAIIRSAVEASQPHINAGRHRLAISLPSEPISLDADAVRLSQAFANLLNNAAKYTNEGGQIWLSAQLDGNTRESAGEVVVSFKDDGIGISSDKLPKIFEMFMQIDHSQQRTQGGLGIGLTLVRTLVEMHGGSVVAHSGGTGKGSEFVIRLPLAKSTVGLSELSYAGAGKTIASSLRVLIVDDNRDAADSLGVLLRRLGTITRVAYDGPAALEVMSTYRPAVVLLDLGMPGMDGFEVVRRMRRRADCAQIIVVALSGWGQEADRRKTAEAGFHDHLVKPVDLHRLQQLLASIESEIDGVPAFDKP